MNDNDRFSFGENWRNFLQHLTPQRISQAEVGVKAITQLDDLSNRTFLDIGSGSGLSSLAARNLGAHVRSFDYDTSSVACTAALKEKYHPNDPNWVIEQGSALDAQYLLSLGTYDIVYSWGVLHHTGDLWRALELLPSLVTTGGRLCLAIYNDQGAQSKIWWHIKRLYNRSPKPAQTILVILIASFFEVITSLYYLCTLRNPLTRWMKLSSERGMSLWHDWVDWIGGFPFEVATPDAIFSFFQQKGFRLAGLKTKRGEWGCCEYLLIKNV